jgi:DNA-directed RNA polymerase subunit M/transcription elongation factor TFIIS
MGIFAKKFRADMIAEIDCRLDAKNIEASDAEKEAAKLKAEYAQLQRTKTRLSGEECPPSVCPNCFYMSHISSLLQTTEPTPEDIDCFKCETCGHEWELPD